jgi:hypothetical protein
MLQVDLFKNTDVEANQLKQALKNAVLALEQGKGALRDG